ncbi:hypothetical protein BN871_ES_00110, partial [Paenibacillus sp. P22]
MPVRKKHHCVIPVTPAEADQWEALLEWLDLALSEWPRGVADGSLREVLGQLLLLINSMRIPLQEKGVLQAALELAIGQYENRSESDALLIVTLQAMVTELLGAVLVFCVSPRVKDGWVGLLREAGRLLALAGRSLGARGAAGATGPTG